VTVTVHAILVAEAKELYNSQAAESAIVKGIEEEIASR
jgi:hypothetical protein